MSGAAKRRPTPIVEDDLVVFSAALNADPQIQVPGPRSEAVGTTFADAMRLLKRARYCAVAVRFATEDQTWNYIQVSRALLARWLLARQLSRPEAIVHSVLSAPYDEELWLLVGVGYDTPPVAGAPS